MKKCAMFCFFLRLYITIRRSKNLNSVQLLFASSSAKFHVQTSVWIENFKQLHINYFMLDRDQIPLNSLLNFPLILTFVSISIFLWNGTHIKEIARKRFPLILEEM
jgi:hypothetical protein